MKRKILLYLNRLLIFFVLIAPLTPAVSGGFQVNLLGIKQIGMGHLGIGLKLDGSSIYFNPGALSVIPDKYSFSAGISGIVASTAFRRSETGILSNTNDQVSTPFYFYGSGKLTDRLSIGLGIYTPFGSGVNWGNDWQGRYLIQNISLKAIFFQPTISFKLHDKISIGAGLIYSYATVKVQQALPLGSNSSDDGQVTLSGNTGAWGFNAGVYLQATERLSFGFTYKSKIQMNLKNGKAEFSVPASLASGFPAGNTFNAGIPLPASINGGVAYKFTDKLQLGVDVNFIQWSAYDSLNFDFRMNTAQLQDSKNARKYKDVLIIRLGGQYAASDKFTVRAGSYFDASPVKNEYVNPETPDANRIGISAGLSFKPISKLSIDASFLFIKAMKRDADYSPKNFAGTYKTNVFIPGLGITYSF